MTIVKLDRSHTARSTNLPHVLVAANKQAHLAQLPYAGRVSPDDAWKLFISGQAHLIDIRRAAERKFAGRVPNTFHIAWQSDINSGHSHFLFDLENKLSKDSIILFLCSCGKNAVDAATLATTAGFKFVFSVGDGAEGKSGWRTKGLPWIQD
jgi:rhodanese-related sulfurtransferase